MSGYVKVFNSMLHSTVWLADDKTRLVWLTMLMLVDRDGVVEASVPGLAAAARVSVEACERALDSFLSPDPFSRTADEGGRRIAVVDGGWRILNYQKYREKMSKADSTEKSKLRMRKMRAARVTQKRNRSVTVTPVTESNACYDIESASESSSEKQEKQVSRKRDVRFTPSQKTEKQKPLISEKQTEAVPLSQEDFSWATATLDHGGIEWQQKQRDYGAIRSLWNQTRGTDQERKNQFEEAAMDALERDKKAASVFSMMAKILREGGLV